MFWFSCSTHFGPTTKMKLPSLAEPSSQTDGGGFQGRVPPPELEMITLILQRLSEEEVCHQSSVMLLGAKTLFTIKHTLLKKRYI